MKRLWLVGLLFPVSVWACPALQAHYTCDGQSVDFPLVVTQSTDSSGVTTYDFGDNHIIEKVIIADGHVRGSGKSFCDGPFLKTTGVGPGEGYVKEYRYAMNAYLHEDRLIIVHMMQTIMLNGLKTDSDTFITCRRD